MSTAKNTTNNEKGLSPQPGLLVLSLGALGVVYGDIGTSPLYAIRECFHGLHAIPLNQTNLFGVLSLVFWSLSIVVTFKYIVFIIRADNNGEGGIFALLALLLGVKDRLSPLLQKFILLAGVFGAALLFGDGVITPAISVLSAIEGLEVATKQARPFIIPLTCIILIILFMLQKRGTGKIGLFFGPIMIVWFSALAVLGLNAILRQPQVLLAVNPYHAVHFFLTHQWQGLIVLGSVVLCITGGEALYADIGHFSPKAIRFSWLCLAFPALILNYFGQGASLLTNPQATFHPFYSLVPGTLLYPLVFLATSATIIASQAMISGVFSIAQQAIQLGYLPRMRIIHTSARQKGQIYVPGLNRLMMLVCVGLVLVFKQSSGLAGAYGIAVTSDMVITSSLFFLMITRRWNWPFWKAGLLVGIFLLFDITYLAANLLKLLDGGWFTISLAAIVAVIMTTWKDGRSALAETLKVPISIKVFLEDLAKNKPYRVPGTAVFMSVNPKGIPGTLLHHFKHNKVLHQRVILFSILSRDIPRINPKERLHLEELGEGLYRLTAFYGFTQTPNVPEALSLAAKQGLKIDLATTTFFLGRESLLTSGPSKMARWRKGLFSAISRNAMNPTNFFGIPPDRVIEIGAQVRL
jgi:KUP system potassium uptake protein